jgi:hypothetical protein
MRTLAPIPVALLLIACTSTPPPQATQVGIPEFQRFLREAYAHPSRSFLHYQLFAALHGDKEALDSLFYQALFYARSPYNYASQEEMHTWTLEAALHTLGEDRFLAALSDHPREVQKAVLAPFDERMLRGQFPKVTALRKRCFPHEPTA